MRWKTFKQMMSGKTEFNDETKFILGVDIGSSMSTLAYWDVTRKSPELIDMSGGYGKPSIPTVVQYIPETNEWVFGEYAMLNKGFFNDITLSNLPEKLGNGEYIEIAGSPMSVVVLLSKLIKELLDSCKNINPNSEIVGIVFSVPNYMSEESSEEFKRAVYAAGFEKELITFMSDKECVLRYNYFRKEIDSEKKILILDYGNKELRGGVYISKPSTTGVDVVALSSLFDKNMGVHKIDAVIQDVILQYYSEEKKIPVSRISSEELTQVENFAYQNKNLVFQNGIQDKSLKLYYNFAYPAFHKLITKEIRSQIAKPYEKELYKFVQMCLSKTVGEPLKISDIDSVICMGGGFEMYWARGVVEGLFPESKINFYKNGGGLLAQGACIGAASYLDVCPQNKFSFTDEHVLKEDIGLKLFGNNREKFYSLFQKSSFWWQPKTKHTFILSQATDVPLTVEIFERNNDGDTIKLTEFALSGLPSRPANTTRLVLSAEFKKFGQLTLNIKDDGFGDFFQKSDFEQEITINY